MRATDIIIKKRNGEVLTKAEIDWLIAGYLNRSVTDYQMSAFCMAVYFRGMTEEETSDLTLAMANSGDTVDLSAIPGIKVDKHSTGGVADTTTLILAPLVAAAGVPVAKMSGRGLGHTGGTVDKLESIPGLVTAIERERFIEQVKRIKLAVVGQSGNLVPADKLLYALRDVTGTIESVPLIASSIMSKKIAAGADAILLDVKVGSGAFMKNYKDALILAQAMVKIGQMLGRETIAVVSDMNEPLGRAVGNSLEVEEAILTLQGKSRGRLRELTLVLASYMLQLAGQAKTPADGYRIAGELLDSGAALQKFTEMVEAQGGNTAAVAQTGLLPEARHSYVLGSPAEGYFNIHDALKIGLAAMVLGAGREQKESVIDLSVGLLLHRRIGDPVKKGQPLVTFFYNDEHKLSEAIKIIEETISISAAMPERKPLVYAVITKNGIETPVI